MTLFLLLIAVVVIVCILATRLSSKFGVPTLLIFILLRSEERRVGKEC